MIINMKFQAYCSFKTIIHILCIISFFYTALNHTYPRVLQSNNSLFFVTLQELIPQARRYITLSSQRPFRYPGFPLDRESILEKELPEDIEGSFPSTFVLELSHASVFGKNGYVLVEENGKKKFFRETLWDWEDSEGAIFKTDFDTIPC